MLTQDLLAFIETLEAWENSGPLKALYRRLQRSQDIQPSTVMLKIYPFMTFDEIKEERKASFDKFITPKGHKELYPDFTGEHPGLDELIAPLVHLIWEIPYLYPTYSCEGHGNKGYGVGNLGIITLNQMIAERIRTNLPPAVKYFPDEIQVIWMPGETRQTSSPIRIPGSRLFKGSKRVWLEWNHLDKKGVIAKLMKTFQNLKNQANIG